MILYLFKRVISFYKFFKIDTPLFIFIISLSSLGLLILYSSSGGSMNLVYKQLIHLGLATSVMLIIAQIPPIFFLRSAPILIILGIILLILVLFFGSSGGGAQRWLDIGIIRFQPSEIMKFLSILYISCYSVRRIKEIQTHWLGFFRPALIIVSIISIILIQPDLGSSAVIFISVLGVLFVAGVKIQQFLVVALLGVIAITMMIIFVPWRWERIISFIDPWSDPWGSGYQLTLSLMSIGRGDWFGVGLGQGLMKMGYLPDAHTDFIFSVIVEEMGILGGFAIISLLFGLSFRIFFIGRESLLRKNFFGFYFSFGVGLLLGLHTFINVGVSSGLLPTKGLTLPLISGGGTNLIIVCLMIGLILRIDYENKNSMPIPMIKRRAQF